MTTNKPSWEKPKYKSVMQVLQSSNDTEAKYKVIEALIDGILTQREQEIVEVISLLKERQLPVDEMWNDFDNGYNDALDELALILSLKGSNNNTKE